MNYPDPLTPPDCDLRDFPFMPLDVVRLRDSDLSIQAEGDEFRAAVLLWCASWHQIPAASLPDDNSTLASLAGYGRVQKEWLKVRDGALRGWVLCSDTRLYHPVVAEKARDAWLAKLRQRFKTECSRIKKHYQRHEIPYVEPDFDEWMSQGCPVGQPLNVPGTNIKRPKDNNQISPGQPGGVPREMHSKGQGEGQGQGQGQGQGEVNLKTITPIGVTGTPAKTGSDAPLAAAEISKSIIGWERERNKAARGINASNQTVIEISEMAVTADELRKAYDMAVADRQATNDPNPVNAGFVKALIDKVRNPPKPRPKADDWSRTDPGIERKASELGIYPRPGEGYAQLRERCESELRKREREHAA
jgi:hypothetical protein